MIGTIIGAIVIGLIMGGLARLVLPGKQNIGVVMTVILGAIGAFVGTWVSYKLGYSNQNGGFKIIPFLVGIVAACILIGIYLGATAVASPIGWDDGSDYQRTDPLHLVSDSLRGHAIRVGGRLCAVFAKTGGGITQLTRATRWV